MHRQREPRSTGTFTFIHLAGERVLHITGNDGRWCVSVDGARLEGWFVSKTDAYAAGLTHVSRIGHDASPLQVGLEA